ncbi:MAG: hypothetical protein HY399_06645 [Elusimicrobia bacterium]|nr:hypothetical protein [Elusimicrobiota bacterium]
MRIFRIILSLILSLGSPAMAVAQAGKSQVAPVLGGSTPTIDPGALIRWVDATFNRPLGASTPLPILIDPLGRTSLLPVSHPAPIKPNINPGSDSPAASRPNSLIPVLNANSREKTPKLNSQIPMETGSASGEESALPSLDQMGRLFDQTGLKSAVAGNLGFKPTLGSEGEQPSRKRPIGFKVRPETESSSAHTGHSKSRAIGFNVPLEKQEPAETESYSKEPVILVTGFEPFGDSEENVSKSLAERLDGTTVTVYGGEEDGLYPHSSAKTQSPQSPPGPLLRTFQVVGRVLPVSFERAGAQIENLIQEIKPRVLLMLGLSGRTPTIELEQMAYNVKHSPEAPDEDGEAPSLRPILDPKMPQLFLSNANVGELAQWLQQRNIPITVSQHAGLFVSNSTYYLALNMIQYLAEQGTLNTLAIFVHLPHAQEHLPEEQRRQVVNSSVKRSMGIAAKLTEWVKALVSTTQPTPSKNTTTQVPPNAPIEYLTEISALIAEWLASAAVFSDRAANSPR